MGIGLDLQEAAKEREMYSGTVSARHLDSRDQDPNSTFAAEQDRRFAREQEIRRMVVKDSGERKQFDSGMVRDVTTGKLDWHRVADGPMLERWAVQLTKGNAKYSDVGPGKPNWTLAAGQPEAQRFRESAFRHFMQWFHGETDEDHAAAVFFNINGFEYVSNVLRPETTGRDGPCVLANQERNRHAYAA